MKLSITTISFLFCAVLLQAQFSKTVNVLPGGIVRSLTNNEKKSVTTLNVEGSIDVRDFKFMKDSLPKLTTINLSKVIIPSIPEKVFKDCEKLKTIVLPTIITSIGHLAFSNCINLSEIEIPNSVTNLGIRAFGGCKKLKTLNISSNVTSISNPFSGCSALINVETSNPNYKSIDGVLYSKDGKTLINCPTSIKGVFVVPPSVISIDMVSFEDCQDITRIKIPSTVSDIDQISLMKCSGLIDVAPDNAKYRSIDGVLFNKDASQLITCPTSKSGDYIIPDSVKYISSFAFSNCVHLTSIKFPLSMSSIDLSAFAGCRGLKEIYIPSNITEIDIRQIQSDKCDMKFSVDQNNKSYQSIDGVLYNKDLTELLKCPTTINDNFTILKTVKTIGECAFEGCKNLTSIIIPESVSQIDEGAFMNCENLVLVSLPSSLKDLGSWLFSGCTSLKSINIETETTYIPDHMFDGCYNLETVFLPQFASTIGDCAFKDCTNLKTIRIPEKVESIGRWAFTECDKLDSLYIPSPVTRLYDWAFLNYNGFITIDSNNLRYSSIDGLIFNKDGTRLIRYPSNKGGDFTIPSTALKIEPNAFQECDNLISVHIPSTVTDLGFGTFKECKNLQTVINMSSDEELGSRLFSGCSNLINVTIPATVSLIREEAFKDCINLTSITLPSSIKNMQKNAFMNCMKLKSIFVYSLEPIVLSKSEDVFMNVNTSNCVLYVPDGSKKKYQEADQWNEFANIIEGELPKLTD
jgi:hypothetical protein